VDFAPYRLLEHAQQQRATGRVDHAFVYQRVSDSIGDAHFRLRLTLTGDALTEVTPFAHVPESFARRFQELRSANNTLANGASLAAGLLYGLGGCVLGTLWLLRRHWLLWRPALVAGLVVGGLLGAMSLSAAPTAWFGFDTAQSVDTFWTRQVGTALLLTFGGAAAYGLALWRRRACRGAPSPIIRSSGASGHATRRRRARCWAAPSAAICSSRSSWR
jgi:hypothetical protein